MRYCRNGVRALGLCTLSALALTGPGCNNAFEGGLTGGLIGGLGGLAIGSLTGSAGAGAAIGAIAGAVGGVIIGDQNDRNARYGYGYSGGGHCAPRCR